MSGDARITPFGEHNGEAVHEIELTAGETTAKIISWGAVLRDLVIATPSGARRVVLGLETLDDYVAHSPSLGAICGRVANRIGGSRFTLDGETHELTNEEGAVHLHGGVDGFDRRVWRIADASANHVTLTLHSPDGDQGYPGAMDAMARYTLLPGPEHDDGTPAGPILRVETSARMTQGLNGHGEARACPVNLVHHSYFNLDGAETVCGHELAVAADFDTPVDQDSVPTGEIVRVDGTAYDFRDARRVGEAALDANLVLRRDGRAMHVMSRNRLVPAARLSAGGLAMEVATSEPGLQLYNSFNMNVEPKGHGRRLGPMAGLCLEPQRFPDSINRPHFSQTVLCPGEAYDQVSEFRFSHDEAPA